MKWKTVHISVFLCSSLYIAIILNSIIFVLSKKEVAQMWAGANQWIGSGPPQRISIYHTSTIKGSNIKIMVCTNCNVEFKSAPGFSCNILHEPLLSKLVNITIIRSSICVGGGNYKRVAYWPLAWATLAKNWSIIGNWPGSILFWIALYIFIPTIQNLYYMYTQDSTSKHSIGCNIRVNFLQSMTFCFKITDKTVTGRK